MTTTVTGDGKVHLPNKRWFYLRDDQEFPVACIASELDEYPNGTKVNFALSVRNPLDDFSRENGRNIAIQRLTLKRNAKEVRKVSLLEDGISTQERVIRPGGPEVVTVDRAGAKEAILTHLSNNIWLPNRVRRAARYRLKVKKERDLARLTKEQQGPH